MKKGEKEILVDIEKKITRAKEKIPSKCIIGETCFTSMAVIGGRLFGDNPKNMNHVHKDTKYLLFVIITLRTDIRGGYTVFYNGVKTSCLVIRAHVLNHLYGRMIFNPFVKYYH